MLAEIYLLRLEAMARASEEATKQPISFRPAHRDSRADLSFDALRQNNASGRSGWPFK